MRGLWLPVVASIGLVCIMVLPTPGVLGIAIGASCLLAIVAWATLWVIDRAFTALTTPMIEAHERWQKQQRRRRLVHARSQIARKR